MRWERYPKLQLLIAILSPALYIYDKALSLWVHSQKKEDLLPTLAYLDVI